MNLAKLIHRAVTDPTYSLALETGTLRLEDLQLPARDLAVVTEVLRDSRHLLSSTSGDLLGKLFNTVCAWDNTGHPG